MFTTNKCLFPTYTSIVLLRALLCHNLTKTLMLIHFVLNNGKRWTRVWTFPANRARVDVTEYSGTGHFLMKVYTWCHNFPVKAGICQEFSWIGRWHWSIWNIEKIPNNTGCKRGHWESGHSAHVFPLLWVFSEWIKFLGIVNKCICVTENMERQSKG